MFSDKSKAVDIEWKIEMFKQSKKYIANFMIKLEVLAMKAETNDMHATFLLKKNIRIDIIKTILGYLPMAALEILREWKVAIISVGQGYESTKSWYNYRIGIKIIYGGRSTFINIGKAKDNFNKNKRPKCFNHNIYRYIAKECWNLKKEWDKKSIINITK